MTTISIYNILSATLFWLATITLIAGMCLLLIPGWLLRLSERLSVWVDTSDWFKKLDEQKNFEREFYSNHKVMGSIIIIGSLYSLWFIWPLRNELHFLLPEINNFLLRNIMQTAVANTLLLGNAFAFIMGCVILLRPSLLKGLEVRLNRWIESGKSLEVLDKKVDIFDQVVPGKPRLFGLLIIIGSIYIMSNTLFAVLPK